MLNIYSNSIVRVNILKTLSAVTARDFSKKHKKQKTNEDQLTEQETFEETPVATAHTSAPTPVWTQSADTPAWLKQNGVLSLDKSLFQPFSLGDIKVVKKTPDNKAPSYEDTIEGRYANVLFTTASK